MSDLNQKASVRQLPPGKLNNLKKIFEDAENSSVNKSEKQMPPARPVQPPTRIKSPVRQQLSQAKLPAAQQQQTTFATQAAKQTSHLKNNVSTNWQHGNNSDKISSTSEATDEPPMREVKKLSPAITGKFSASPDSPLSSQSDGKGFAAGSQFPRPALRHSQEHNKEAEAVTSESSSLSSGQEGTRVSNNVSDAYAKVNKPPKKNESLTRKITFSPGDKIECSIPRREAIRKTAAERRKTVAGGEVENVQAEVGGVTVAQRTKLFDSSKTDKPTLPQKPPAVKKNFSFGPNKEFEEPQKNQFQTVNRNEDSSEVDNMYEPPWDLSKNSLLEKLKKMQPPELLAPLSAKCDSSSSAVKSVASPKSSVCNEALKRSDKGSKDNDNGILRNPLKGKVPEPALESSPQHKVAPPPKPPRTHAHDDYLKVKVSNAHNLEANLPTNVPGQAALRKTVHVIEIPQNGDAPGSTGFLSVKDRISKMQQKSDPTSSEPPPLPSVSFANKNTEQNIVIRNPAPSRPPPPKRRPNSLDHPHAPSALSQSQIGSIEDEDFGPIIIPVSPRSQLHLEKTFSDVAGVCSRKPNDTLPPEPDLSKQLQKFPLRKSYSSECLHSSRGSSLNGELEDCEGWGGMSQSSYGSRYEAVIDPDGYAVPNVFKRVPFIKNENLDISPSKFLTRIKGFSGDALANENGGAHGMGVTSAQEQSLDKVNKKKMTVVRQKINQAYADVNISVGLMSNTLDSEWQIVDPERSMDESALEPTVLKKRIEYCSSVRLKSCRNIRHCKEYLSAIYPQLFEYCLIVGLQQLVDASGYEPYVMHKFPENVSSNLSVPNFCFPDASIFKPGSTTSINESYSFVMTNSDGSRVYGYCRRIQPSDSNLPEVICIISPIDAFNMYNTLLNEIETRRRISFDLASELIAASFGRPLPKRGKVCQIRTLDNQGEMETIYLSRSADNKLENVNYESPLHYLGTDRLVKVFSSMLMERRIILCSSNLSVLTQTVHALSALLYPFQWQHVYIPLLPHEMLDVLCAPVPFIVGVLTAFLPRVLKLDLEEVFIVDVDKKNIVKSQGDESTILPKRVQKALKTAINMCKIDAEARNAQWLMVAEAFLRMFIETVGHFNNHIRVQQDGSQIFQKESFILDMSSKEVREFLSWFTETQMFNLFIMNHVEKSDSGTSDLFLQRLAEYKESKEESSRNKGLGAKVKNFGKALKTKLHAS